jgi:hypothetical protein
MVSESFAAKRMRGLNLIVNSLEEIDNINLTGGEAVILDKQKLIVEVMIEFEIKEDTATVWVNEALKMYELQHNSNLKREKYLRNTTK